MKGTHAFSAQNGYELYFGLGNDPSVTLEEVSVTWPGGESETLTSGLEINSLLEIDYTDLVDGRESSPSLSAELESSDRSVAISR